MKLRVANKVLTCIDDIAWCWAKDRANWTWTTVRRARFVALRAWRRRLKGEPALNIEKARAARAAADKLLEDIAVAEGLPLPADGMDFDVEDYDSALPFCDSDDKDNRSDLRPFRDEDEK